MRPGTVFSANVAPSCFEGGDGNLTVNEAPFGANTYTDWASLGVANLSGVDDKFAANTNLDTQFSGGKELEPPTWELTAGPATPDKANILAATTYVDKLTNDLFLYVAFERKGSTGNTNLSIELNNDATLWDANPDPAKNTLFPTRSPGDALITYDGGAGSVNVGICQWVGTKFGQGTGGSGAFGWFHPNGTTQVDSNTDCAPLTAAIAKGNVNSGTVLNTGNTILPAPFSTSMVANTFGELTINLSDALASSSRGPCFDYGSMWMHSRSSDTVTSSMQDIVLPFPIVPAATCRISVDKTVQANSSVTPPASGYADDIFASTGDKLWYRMAVTNDGTYPLTTGPTVTDPNCVSAVTAPTKTGDATPATFDPGDTWVYYCSRTSLAGDANPFVNTATATGTIGTGPGAQNLSDTDTATVRRRGSITVVKYLSPSAATGFDLSVAGNVVADNVGNTGTGSAALNPGTYTVAEALDATNPNSAGDYVSKVLCSKTGVPSSADVAASGAAATSTSVTVASGEAWTCAFRNDLRATVQVIKDAQPNDAQDFTFTGTGSGIPSSFDLDDDADATLSNTRTFTITTFGSKSISETPTSGWSLTATSCQNGNGAPQSNATIDVQPGDAWTCTFTNKKDATVRVIKDAQPNDGQDFAFTTTGLGAGFSLDDDADGTLSATKDITVTADGLGYGSKTISETPTSGWSLTATSCQNGNGAPQSNATIDVQPGDAWTCTFTNKKDATVRVIKDAQPNDGQDFAFTTTGLGAGFSLDDDADGTLSATKDITVTADGLGYGSKTISETPTSGWSLTATSCQNGNGAPQSNATIDVQPGDAWTCTFTNKKDAKLTIVKDAQPNDAQDFAFTATGSGMPGGFGLDDDGTAGNPLSASTSFTFAAGQYGSKLVTETPVTGWDLADITCTDAGAATSRSYGVLTAGQLTAGAAGTSFGTGDDTAEVAVVAGSDTTCTFTNQQVNLTVSKTADATTVDAGDPIGFTVVTSNAGPGTARSVTLSDPLPNGVDWSIDPANADCEITGTGDDQVLTCDFGNLADDASETVHVSATTSYTACTTYDNEATASATNAPDAKDDASITCRKPELVVEKTADAVTVDAGAPIGFTVKTTNNGPGIAKSVTLSDPLPNGVDWSIDPANTDCEITGTGDDQVLSCDFGALGDDASETVHVTATTSFAACTTYDNEATASSTNAPDTSDDATVTCLKPELVVEKTADATTVDAGAAIGFTVKTTNNGPGTANAVTLSDPLPNGVDWSIDPANADCEITGTGDDQVLSCDFGALGDDASETVHVKATTSFAACTTYDNEATASATNSPDASDDATVTCLKPELVVEKTADAATVDAGDPIGFTVKTTNNGPGIAKAVTLSDPLPNGVDWSIDPANADCEITGTGDDQVLTCDFGDLADDASETVHVKATTSESACTTYDNEATATATNHPNAKDDASITCNKPDLGVDKAALNVTVDAGDDVSFDITTSNAGPGTAKSVTLNDPLPNGVAWSISPANADCEITGTGDDQVLTCEFGDIPAGENRKVTVTAKTSFEQCAQYVNTATADAINAPQKTDSDTITCRKPDLKVEKTADADVVDAGEAVGFTVKTTNNGPGTAKAVTLKDPLPNGLTGRSTRPTPTARSPAPATTRSSTATSATSPTTPARPSTSPRRPRSPPAPPTTTTATATATNHPDASDDASDRLQRAGPGRREDRGRQPSSSAGERHRVHGQDDQQRPRHRKPASRSTTRCPTASTGRSTRPTPTARSPAPATTRSSLRLRRPRRRRQRDRPRQGDDLVRGLHDLRQRGHRLRDERAGRQGRREHHLPQARRRGREDRGRGHRRRRRPDRVHRQDDEQRPRHRDGGHAQRPAAQRGRLDDRPGEHRLPDHRHRRRPGPQLRLRHARRRRERDRARQGDDLVQRPARPTTTRPPPPRPTHPNANDDASITCHTPNLKVDEDRRQRHGQRGRARSASRSRRRTPAPERRTRSR